MAWCHQATSHYFSQCWPRSMSPYGVTGPQWVNTIIDHDTFWHHNRSFAKAWQTSHMIGSFWMREGGQSSSPHIQNLAVTFETLWLFSALATCHTKQFFLVLTLTHWAQVMHICISKLTSLVQIWLVTWSVPRHYLNQCWNIVNWTPSDNLQWNCNQSS